MGNYGTEMKFHYLDEEYGSEQTRTDEWEDRLERLRKIRDEIHGMNNYISEHLEKGEKMSTSGDLYWDEEDYWKKFKQPDPIEMDTIAKATCDIVPKNYILDLHPYCENCPAFEAKQKTDCMNVEDFVSSKTIRIHRITCEKNSLCEQLYSFIERKYKNGKN